MGGAMCLPSVLKTSPMKLAGVQFARPILPPGPADAEQLACRLALVRREHDAEGRNHCIECAVVEGKLLGVRNPVSDVEGLGLCASAAARQQRVDIVGRRHRAHAPCECEGGIAVASRHVENRRGRSEVHGFGQRLADDLESHADPGVVAGGPGGVLFGLDGRIVRG